MALRAGRRHLCPAVLLASFALIGCGYTTGYRLPGDVTRLSVPIFRNDTFPLRREVEYDLTRAVRRELQVRSDVDLVTQDRAQAVLEGDITSFRQGVATEGPGDTVQDSSIQLVVRVRLRQIPSGQVLVDRDISDSTTFSVLAGETLDDARAKAIQDLAKRIVAELELWF